MFPIASIYEVDMDYTLRDIPLDLHRAWKTSAALKGETMKDFCYRALQNQVRKDIEREVSKNGSTISADSKSAGHVKRGIR